MAASYSARNPPHPFARELHESVFQKIGRISETMYANEKALLLEPADDEEHNNVRNIL